MKQKYLSPCSESMDMLVENVICTSVGGDGTIDFTYQDISDSIWG